VKGTRGYALLTVLVILLILLTAGVYGMRAAEMDIRASSKFRRAELLGYAAEAGASLRLSEIAIVSEPIAILNDEVSDTYRTWTSWPPNGQFTTPEFDAGSSLQYRTGPIHMTWTGQTPPPGVPVGTNTYIFELTSFATFVDGSGSEAGESAVSIAFKTWDTLPGSYAP
jgi:hypothetical protein